MSSFDSPVGILIAGIPARFAGIVQRSDIYISNGFSVFSESGELVSAVRRPYEEKHPQPHGICIDSKGNIYLAQLPARKKADMDHKVSKYVKIR